jgi:hypothetical protein
MPRTRDYGLVIEWLYVEGDEVPSPDAVAVLLHLVQVHPERIPLWAAHWLVRGYDGEHLVQLAGLHGDDPREVRDVLPGALRDCGVRLPDSDVVAAGSVFTLLARRHLDGTAGAGRVISIVGSVLAWCGYPETVMDLPLGQLMPIEDEWDESWGRTREELAAVVRDACQKQLASVPDAT